MLNHYETVFILTPVLSDVQMKEAVEKFKAILTENGATITNEENWVSDSKKIDRFLFVASV